MTIWGNISIFFAKHLKEILGINDMMMQIHPLCG